MLVFLQTLEGWVYKDPIHGPLYGPLYMGSIYSNTPPQSELPAQRCSRLDNKKANTPPQSEQPTQRCSRLDKKRVHRANTPPPQPQLATGYVEAGSKLREGRRGQPLGLYTWAQYTPTVTNKLYLESKQISITLP